MLQMNSAFKNEMDDLFIKVPRRPNQLKNIAGLIAQWDAKDYARNAQCYQLRHSPEGNINSTGGSGGLCAPAIPFWHSQFKDSVEKRVWSLVEVLINKGNWISYTSCEGHYYLGKNLPNSELHVGLLPRNNQEYLIMHSFLHKLVIAARCTNKFPAVQPSLMIHTLDNSLAPYPVIDVYLSRSPNVSWDEYFTVLENATSAFVKISHQMLGTS